MANEYPSFFATELHRENHESHRKSPLAGNFAPLRRIEHGLVKIIYDKL
jgi:hypothetical protein